MDDFKQQNREKILGIKNCNLFIKYFSISVIENSPFIENHIKNNLITYTRTLKKHNRKTE